MKKTPKLEKISLSQENFKRTNRRAFLVAGISACAGILGITSIVRMREERSMPWFLRKANHTLDAFWKASFRTNAKAPPVDADGNPVRINGDVGMLESIDIAKYRLTVIDPHLKKTLHLTLNEIKKLPAVNESFEFKCIEGWSAPVSCKGVRFSDFMDALQIGKDFAYAGMTSIDGDYFVSWDAKSLLHPQTLLCYEMNGLPLKPENGAPLRILSSVKYGVKQIKQIGQIAFSDTLPPDYWANEGYTDYLGL